MRSRLKSDSERCLTTGAPVLLTHLHDYRMLTTSAVTSFQKQRNHTHSTFPTGRTTPFTDNPTNLLARNITVPGFLPAH